MGHLVTHFVDCHLFKGMLRICQVSSSYCIFSWQTSLFVFLRNEPLAVRPQQYLSKQYIFPLARKSKFSGSCLKPVLSTSLKSSVFYRSFGGLVVSMLVSGTHDRGFDPGRSRRIFRAKKSTACLPWGGK